MPVSAAIEVSSSERLGHPPDLTPCKSYPHMQAHAVFILNAVMTTAMNRELWQKNRVLANPRSLASYGESDSWQNPANRNHSMLFPRFQSVQHLISLHPLCLLSCVMSLGWWRILFVSDPFVSPPLLQLTLSNALSPSKHSMFLSHLSEKMRLL